MPWWQSNRCKLVFSNRVSSESTNSRKVRVPAESSQNVAQFRKADDHWEHAAKPKSPPNAEGTKDNTSKLDRTTLWLRRADQMLLGFLLIALVILLIAFRWKLSGGFQREIEIANQQPREYYYSIDINKASWVEWAQLEGIGEKLAKRIVQDRTDRGSFNSINDLRRVRGLGPKVVEKLKPFLKCPTCESKTP